MNAKLDQPIPESPASESTGEAGLKLVRAQEAQAKPTLHSFLRLSNVRYSLF